MRFFLRAKNNDSDSDEGRQTKRKKLFVQIVLKIVSWRLLKSHPWDIYRRLALVVLGDAWKFLRSRNVLSLFSNRVRNLNSASKYLDSLERSSLDPPLYVYARNDVCSLCLTFKTWTAIFFIVNPSRNTLRGETAIKASLFVPRNPVKAMDNKRTWYFCTKANKDGWRRGDDDDQRRWRRRSQNSKDSGASGWIILFVNA